MAAIIAVLRRGRRQIGIIGTLEDITMTQQQTEAAQKQRSEAKQLEIYLSSDELNEALDIAIKVTDALAYVYTNEPFKSRFEELLRKGEAGEEERRRVEQTLTVAVAAGVSTKKMLQKVEHASKKASRDSRVAIGVALALFALGTMVAIL